MLFGRDENVNLQQAFDVGSSERLNTGSRSATQPVTAMKPVLAPLGLLAESAPAKNSDQRTRLAAALLAGNWLKGTR